jgi:hypothetical protein
MACASRSEIDLGERLGVMAFVTTRAQAETMDHWLIREVWFKALRHCGW